MTLSSCRWLTVTFNVIVSLQGLILFCVIFFDSKKVDLLQAKLRGKPSGSDMSQRRPSNVATMATSMGDELQHKDASEKASFSKKGSRIKLSLGSKAPEAVPEETELV